jgi:hypothetical protein
MGEPAVSPTYCPINGAYSFTYSVNDGTENSLECAQHTSDIADCPYGFGFNLNFKGCSFANMDMSFHCLGDWEGPDGQRYVALMDTQATPKYGAGDGGERPRYRCAVSCFIHFDVILVALGQHRHLAHAGNLALNGKVFKMYNVCISSFQLFDENEKTGEIHMALSSDSTCTNRLHSPTDGHETLRLRPRPLPTWPSHLGYPATEGHSGGTCQMPDWTQGKWEHIHVDGGTLLLKDQRNFKTYTARCVGQGRPSHEERFLVYARTQCGDEHYKCVWLKNRGNNALEMQIGKLGVGLSVNAWLGLQLRNT